MADKIKFSIVVLAILFFIGVIATVAIDMLFIAKPYSDKFVIVDKYIDTEIDKQNVKKEYHYFVYQNNRFTFKNNVNLSYFYKYNVSDTVTLYNMKLGIFSYLEPAKIK